MTAQSERYGERECIAISNRTSASRTRNGHIYKWRDVSLCFKRSEGVSEVWISM